jgi:uncharacterized membrane-anchored protein YitT (DUF2179 family)
MQAWNYESNNTCYDGPAANALMALRTYGEPNLTMKQKIRTIMSGLNLKDNLRNYFILTLGSLVLAFNAALFLAPFNLTPGGVLSVSIIIAKFANWPVGRLMLILNIPMLILGFRYLGRFRFLIRSTYVVLLYSLSIDLFANWLPAQGVTDNLLLNSLYAGIVGGIGTGIIFRSRGTAGGTSIIGRVVQLKTGIPISQIYLVTDGAIIGTAGLIFGWERALYALITVFIWGLASDYVLEGPSVVRTAFIVTDSPHEVATALMARPGLGVTAWAGQGMFTDAEHTILFCTLSRPDVSTLQEAVAQADPDAFVVIGHGHQATGGVLRPAPGTVKPVTTKPRMLRSRLG